MSDSELREQLEAKKDDLLELITKALRVAELDLDLDSITFRASKRGPKCPPGHKEVFEGVEQTDGTVKYRWVCKPS